MASKEPKTGFGKRVSTKSVSEHIRNYLITLGLNRMAEPVRLLTKWLTDQPSERVTVVSSEPLTAERAAKLLSEVGVESKVIDRRNRLSDVAACLLTIPPLCERLEDLPLITEVVIVENLKNYSREIEGIHPSHIPVLYFLCHKYKSGAGLDTPILNEDTYAGFLRKALGENLFDKTVIKMVPYSFQDGESGDTKDALRPFVLLEDKRIEFYLNDLPNASQYGIEDRKIAASLIELDDPDPISGIRPPHPGRVRSVASTEYRLFAEANLSKRDCNGRKLVGIENLQQRMKKIGAKCIPCLAKLKISPIQNIYTLSKESKSVLSELISHSRKNREGLTPTFKLYKTDSSAVFNGKKYSLRRGKYFEALIVIANEHLRGNPWVGKDYIFTSCGIDNDYICNSSVRSWFIRSRGDACRFAKDRLLEFDGKGGCRISVDPEYIEIAEFPLDTDIE